MPSCCNQVKTKMFLLDQTKMFLLDHNLIPLTISVDFTDLNSN